MMRRMDLVLNNLIAKGELEFGEVVAIKAGLQVLSEMSLGERAKRFGTITEEGSISLSEVVSQTYLTEEDIKNG